jgi:glyoxylase-like metal-dependent hydrolase (beta-lactamase superfamily II)
VNDSYQFDTDIWLTDVTLSDFDVRGALVRGSERAVVWDTLSHPRDMACFRPLVEDGDLVIVYSHADWDHVWGTAGLPYERALIVGHDASVARFADDVPRTLEAKRAAEPGAWDAVRLVAPTVVFERDYVVNLGSLTMTLHHLPGHTADAIVAFVPERGLLLMGDTAETLLPVVPSRASLSRWIAGLQEWEADARVRIVMPSHGRIGGREILQQNIRYLQRLSAGLPFDVAEPLSPFYRATHEENLRACCGGTANP